MNLKAVRIYMIKRLPRFAEVQLQSLCAEQGALCQEVQEDESGWDYLVEFPSEKHSGPADTHPPSKQAFVQVKSAERHRLTCRVKLSNALRAVQSRQPWFIVLMTANRGKSPVRVLAVHVWDEVMRDILKAVRQAEIAARPLHKVNHVIRFDENVPDKNLIAWMAERIGAVGNYEQNKKSIFETVGYEEGHGIGKVTFEAANAEEISMNFLGLGKGLKLKQFSFSPSRFGLTAPKPDVDFSAGIFHVSPNPVGNCELRMRSPHAMEQIVCSGQVFTTGFPGRPVSEQAFRFSTETIEMIWTPGKKWSFEVDLDWKKYTGLSVIEDFAKLNTWADRGPVDVQVWTNGKRMLAGTLKLQGAPLGKEGTQVLAAVKLLRIISGEIEDRLQLRLADLFLAPGLATFIQIMSPSSFRCVFNPFPNAPSRIDSLLYYWTEKVGEHLFFALVERKVSEDIVIDGEQRRLTAGNPRFAEAYVFTNPSEADSHTIKADYDRHLSILSSGGNIWGLGDIREQIASEASAKAHTALNS